MKKNANRGKKAMWFINPSQSIPAWPDWFFRKSIERAPDGKLMLWRENPPRRYKDLKDDDLLDTNEVMRLFHISEPTMYRYVGSRGLKPALRVGRLMLFRKKDLEQWREWMVKEQEKWPLKAQSQEGRLITKSKIRVRTKRKRFKKRK